MAAALFTGAMATAAFSTQGQNFQNLNFEAANIPAGTPQGAGVSAATAMPGWTPSMGPQAYPTILSYDGISTGGAVVTIADSNVSYGFAFVPLQGKYSAILFAGPDGPAGDCSISQTGLVPANTQSIRMDIESPFGGLPIAGFTVTLGGDTISMTPIQQFSTFILYGGNLPGGLAGQTEALTITALPPTFPIVPPSALAVDNIIFSPVAVPEPATCALILVGVAFLGLKKATGRR